MLRNVVQVMPLVGGPGNVNLAIKPVLIVVVVILLAIVQILKGFVLTVALMILPGTIISVMGQIFCVTLLLIVHHRLGIVRM